MDVPALESRQVELRLACDGVGWVLSCWTGSRWRYEREEGVRATRSFN